MPTIRPCKIAIILTMTLLVAMHAVAVSADTSDGTPMPAVDSTPTPEVTATALDPKEEGVVTATITSTVAVTSTITPTLDVEPTATPTSTPVPMPTPTVTATGTAAATPTLMVCAEPAGQVVMDTFPSPVQGKEQPVRVYLPPCYGQYNRLYPALYLFHGNIYTESQWDDLGIDEAADAGIAAGLWPPFMIIMPYGGEIANSTAGGDISFEGVVVNELVPYIEDQYCAWPEPAGRAMGGLSRGGYWSLEIGFRYPEMWAAIGGHSAALFSDNASPVFNPVDTWTILTLVETPLYLDMGEGDWLRQGAYDLHAALDAAGVEHEWQLNPGEHTESYWRQHVPEYLAWYTYYWPADLADFPSAAGRLCRP